MRGNGMFVDRSKELAAHAGMAIDLPTLDAALE
jgi:hypothetical protein